MAYQALYRKHRPTDFSDVKGQDPIVRTLSNQVKTGRIGHAYLFCGTRGTGKTSVAKVFSRAINCENPENGNPCNRCQTCKSILEGTNLSVAEIDAASNNGVDSIRQIVEEVKYSPTDARYRVYIIDEVHMLSIGAFNALLKTLEEPPAYAVFVLATTEAHKIPITILSRCQRYDFKRISIDTIASRLRELCDKDGIEAEEDALRYIAKCGEGSLRDALSLLERCLAFYFDDRLTYDKIIELLGTSDVETFAVLLRYIKESRVDCIMRLVEEQVLAGRDLTRLVIDFTWYIRNLLLAGEGGNIGQLLEVSGEQMNMLMHEAKVFETQELMRYINILSELSNRLRYASGKRVLVETELIRMAKPQMDVDTDALTDRIRKLEAKLTSLMENGYTPSTEKNEAEAADSEQAEYEYIPEALPEDIEKLVQNWNGVQNAAAGSVKCILAGARPSITPDGKLLLLLANAQDAEYISDDFFRNEIEKAINGFAGKSIEVTYPSYPKLDTEEVKKVNKKHISLDTFLQNKNFKGIEIVSE
ncbi:MAG: DNA polymerase III subunit gamma/tau [Clostridiales bacterium]|nr:DNA polymerase III subunit gamma/tau [Clostridiales bacterium]